MDIMIALMILGLAIIVLYTIYDAARHGVFGSKTGGGREIGNTFSSLISYAKIIEVVRKTHPELSDQKIIRCFWCAAPVGEYLHQFYQWISFESQMTRDGIVTTKSFDVTEKEIKEIFQNTLGLGKIFNVEPGSGEVQIIGPQPNFDLQQVGLRVRHELADFSKCEIDN